MRGATNPGGTIVHNPVAHLAVQPEPHKFIGARGVKIQKILRSKL